MKKLLALFLAFTMLLSGLVLSSCSLSNNEDNHGKVEDENGDNGNNENHESHENNPSGENQESGSNDNLPIDQDSAQAKLEELGKTDGYEITMKVIDVDGDERINVTGRKGNVWWVYSDDKSSGTALVDRDGTSIISYELDDSEWNMGQNLVGQDFSYILPIYSTTTNVYLFIANAYDGSLKYEGKDNVAGRACSKYSYSTGVMGASLSYAACIDDLTGVTLKWIIETTSEGVTGSQQMEVLSFKTGSSVVIPDLPAPSEDYMDFTGAMGWPSNSFTAMIPQAPGTVTTSMIQDNQFAVMLNDVSEDDFNSYVSSLISYGFDGESQDASFEGYDTNGNCVNAVFADGQLAISVTKSDA